MIMNSLAFTTEVVNAVPCYDTHEHIAGFDWGYAADDAPIGYTHPRLKSLPHLLMNDMLRYAVGATKIDNGPLAPELWQVEDAP